MHQMTSFYLVKERLTVSIVIELNLRLPSMLHGKKGFDRIVWAFKNVLNQSLAWLFCDLETSPDQGWCSLLYGVCKEDKHLPRKQRPRRSRNRVRK
jgi:hypothetical protein